MSILLRRPSPTSTVTPPSALSSPLEPAADSATIERLADDPDFSYADLRRRGIALTQALSGELWTDYNHHDPGVTLLESLCYTITENVFGADAEIADLLTAPDGRIHYRRHALHGAEEALPCRPTTELDLMRYLLDRVPAVRQLRVTMPAGDGLWRMALRVADGDDQAAARDTARAFRAQRNLGEDLETLPQVLKPRWCGLQLQMSVEGPRDLNDILVELVQRCAQLVSAAPPRRPIQARLSQRDALGRPLGTSRLFEGPALQCGWIAEEDLRRDPANRLYFSDLSRALRDIEGVADISALQLVPQDATADHEADDHADGEDSLQWHGPDWALQLRWPETEAALAGWQINRRGSRLHIDTRDLLAQLADARQAARIASVPPRTRAYAGQLISRPTGHYVPEVPYLSTWHHLPPLYREAHLAPGADAERQAQFGAYLALLEQWMAHGSAQLQHLRELFSIAPQPTRSYWWEPLGPEQVPGLEGVCVEPPDAVAQTLEAGDDTLVRRSRVLDQLLALHGENCDQHSIQRFGYYFDAAGWQAHLYECKRRFVQRIVRHTRDRAGAFDYSRSSLGRRGNTAPLQERIGLLLGFAQQHSRLLAGELTVQGMAIDTRERQAPAAQPPADAEALPMGSPARARIAAHHTEDIGLGQVAERLVYYFTSLDPRAWPGALLRCAAHAGRYHRGTGADGTQQLWLGPDEHGRWWPLAVREGPGGVLAPALYLHEFACRVQRDAEGLHLVEHVLLRPLGAQADAQKADVPADFYANRISVILPGWTARGADQSFRDLAEETIALGCPAHILPHVHWLDAPTLAAFEHDFTAWLHARQAQAQTPDDAAVTAHTDACAAALRRRLATPREGARS